MTPSEGAVDDHANDVTSNVHSIGSGVTVRPNVSINVDARDDKQPENRGDGHAALVLAGIVNQENVHSDSMYKLGSTAPAHMHT